MRTIYEGERSCWAKREALKALKLLKARSKEGEEALARIKRWLRK